MKNDTLKYFLLFLCISVFFTSLITYNFISTYQNYNRNTNYKLASIFEKIQEEYPELSTDEIVAILNSSSLQDSDLFRDYGIDLDKNALVLKNGSLFSNKLLLNLVLLVTFIVVCASLFFLYVHRHNKRIREITELIDKINHRNYHLDIADNREDNLSILQNELYKTTIMLNELAEHEKNDKLLLKRSLEDISHQLKTPLTTILISLDNLLDNPDMDMTTRNNFLNSMKREINNINFLVTSLLKLSRLETNTIKFNHDVLSLEKIISESIKNVSLLCDLKNIKIVVAGSLEATLTGDFSWQVEALTNILKNAVEHSPIDSIINISYEENKVFSKIVIQDHGEGISSEDQKHIFERFYKSKNSSKDSFGIGLSLSKSIIDNNNGLIKVESNKNKGTSFIIKYFK